MWPPGIKQFKILDIQGVCQQNTAHSCHLLHYRAALQQRPAVSSLLPEAERHWQVLAAIDTDSVLLHM